MRTDEGLLAEFLGDGWIPDYPKGRPVHEVLMAPDELGKGVQIVRRRCRQGLVGLIRPTLATLTPRARESSSP